MQLSSHEGSIKSFLETVIVCKYPDFLRNNTYLVSLGEKSIYSSDAQGVLGYKYIGRHVVFKTNYFVCSKYPQMRVQSCQLHYRKRVSTAPNKKSTRLLK